MRLLACVSTAKTLPAFSTAPALTRAPLTRRIASPGHFFATLSSGHSGVFRRLGKTRLPIKELWGSGVAQVMG